MHKRKVPKLDKITIYYFGAGFFWFWLTNLDELTNFSQILQKSLKGDQEEEAQSDGEEEEEARRRRAKSQGSRDLVVPGMRRCALSETALAQKSHWGRRKRSKDREEEGEGKKKRKDGRKRSKEEEKNGEGMGREKVRKKQSTNQVYPEERNSRRNGTDNR